MPNTVLVTKVTMKDTPDSILFTIRRLVPGVVLAYTIHFYAMMLILFNACHMTGVLTDATQMLLRVFLFLNFMPLFMICYYRSRDTHWVYVINTHLLMYHYAVIGIGLSPVPWLWYCFADFWKRPLDKVLLFKFFNFCEQNEMFFGIRNVFTEDIEDGLALKILAVDLLQTIVQFILFFSIVLLLHLCWLCAREDTAKTHHHVQFEAFGLVNCIFPEGLPTWKFASFVILTMTCLNVDYSNLWLCLVFFVQCALWTALVRAYFPPEVVDTDVTLMQPRQGWPKKKDSNMSSFITAVGVFNKTTYTNLFKMWLMYNLCIIVFKLMMEGSNVLYEVSWWMNLLTENPEKSLSMQVYAFLNVVCLEADYACVMFLLFLMMQITANVQAFPSDKVPPDKGHGTMVMLQWTYSQKTQQVHFRVSYSFANALEWVWRRDS